ncbi:substrate-binding domain-containing protein [Bordetella sp. FB-8]|uniref:molybdate ABC transporter substrate-binding protein n=1 Tax=Bordetella sp. FB-8 TaxID=1159870 RepID=UPI00035ECB4A|nr:substrate-binding domain-containing protein [Bordetella sp. FB-8]
MELVLFSGGAAKAVASGLQGDFEAQQGCAVSATFGAVGLMRDKLLSGEPCDVLILSASLITALEQQGYVVAGSARDLGSVATGVAVRAGDPAVAIGEADALRAALSAARGLYVPHLGKSSAGIHVANVLERLELTQVMRGRVREYPNGATAMRELAAATGGGLMGCTQVTEILYTPGVKLVGELPPGYGLDTVYTAAVCTQARHPELACRFVQALSGDASRRLRQHSGFKLDS